MGMSPPPPPAMPVDLASHTEGPSPEAREPDMAQGPFLGSVPIPLHQVFGRIAHPSSLYPELDVQGANFFDACEGTWNDTCSIDLLQDQGRLRR